MQLKTASLMNFLTHALPILDQPHVVAGTALPDLLRATDRQLRVRRKMALQAQQASDALQQQIATGILRHIDDDHWFHTTAAFVEVNLQLAVQLRERLPGDRGFRPMFLGHILIEIFLDAVWIEQRPELAARYYQIFASLPADVIQDQASQIMGRSTAPLAATWQRFGESRFLYDYSDRSSLLVRLNQVMRRVGLRELPESLLPWLAAARELVESRFNEFLTKPDGSLHYPLPSQD